MIKEKSERFTVKSPSRVDKAASEFVKRSVFSHPDTEIFINGKKVKKSAKVNEGDIVDVIYREDVFEGLQGEDIPLEILYEDDDILVINKEQGIVVHPGSGVSGGTIANALLFRYGDSFLSESDPVRPGIVHRLDKDTSGVMVIAKNENALRILSDEFKERKTRKYYLVLAKGNFTLSHGIIEKNIVRDRNDRKKFTVCDDGSGRSAKTEYNVLFQGKGYAFLKVRIYTGRTHQIRVHLKSIGHPVIGDSIYSRDEGRDLMLHSYSLTLIHPRSGKEMTFETGIPERFRPYLAEYCDIGL